ncbi:MAG: TraB/GumN family protein [Saprospiraceae bacterium]|nr:TraB/GumN family protein [Saprospiraceae bacterium]
MNRKKHFICLTLAFLSAASYVFSQTAPVEAIPEKATTLEDRNSLLWKVTGKGLKAPSYVFGTIHLINKEDFIFTEKMEKAFQEAKAVTFEIKLDDMNNMSSQMSMMMKAFMDEGKTLRDLISEEDYKIVQNHFSKIGLPLVLLERMKPMFLSALASGDISPEKMSSGEIVSYEFQLMDKAKAQNKPISGLETMEFQMSLFDSIPYEAQAKMLVDGIKKSDASEDQFKKMVELYKNQDLEGMQRDGNWRRRRVRQI